MYLRIPGALETRRPTQLVVVRVAPRGVTF